MAQRERHRENRWSLKMHPTQIPLSVSQPNTDHQRIVKSLIFVNVVALRQQNRSNVEFGQSEQLKTALDRRQPN